jgi:hypothetical protein
MVLQGPGRLVPDEVDQVRARVSAKVPASLSESDVRYCLRRLAAAAYLDEGKPRQSRDGPAPDALGNAVNAAMVLAGLRPGARFESLAAGSHFVRELSTIVEEDRSGRFRLLPNSEPMLIDLRRVSARDVTVLERLYVNGHDHEERLVGAMGRALGYACSLPSGRRQWYEVRARVVTKLSSARPISSSFYLYACSCPRGPAFRKAWASALTAFEEANSSPLIGCELEWGGVTYTLNGFETTFK